jgi:hypothetical protein
MRTQQKNTWKHMMVIGILTTFLFPATVHAHYGSTMFGIYKNHHYVYYPKQNFYYDPFAGNYIVVENGVWVRQLRPPRVFTRININVLPHVDVYVDSYYPYYENENHRYRYRIMRYMTPSASFYAFRLPVRYDFSITAYEFYEPETHIVFVNYDPNLYCHPHHHGRGHAYGHYKNKHHGHDDHYYAGYGRPYPNQRPNGHGHHNNGNNNGGRHPGDFHKPDNKPHNPHAGNGNQNNDRHPGDFHQKNEKQHKSQPATNRNPGDFHQKNEKQHKEQQRPEPNRNPGGFHHQKDPDRRQEKPQVERRPGDYHSKGTKPSAPAKGPRRKGGH